MSINIEYTDKMPEWVGGRFIPPIFPIFNLFGLGHGKIQIKTKYSNDNGILEHELEHYNQYKNNFFHIIKYKYSKVYRLECELLAYEKQIKHYNYDTISQCKWIIDALVTKYDLGFTQKYITKRINRILNGKT